MPHVKKILSPSSNQGSIALPAFANDNDLTGDEGAIAIVAGELVRFGSNGLPVTVGGGGSSITPVLSELPALDASKAGQQFFFNGTLWTYAQTGQFGTLPVGTPWPVKGYKVFVARLEFNGTQSVGVTIINSDFDSGISFDRSDVGLYEISLETIIDERFADFDTVHIQFSPTFVYNQQLTGGIQFFEFDGDTQYKFESTNFSGQRVDLVSNANNGTQFYWIDVKVYPPTA